jgi:hypothetical protein
MKLSCACKSITKQQNNVSSKMLQAQMIKTNGRYKYKYSNSNTDTIHKIIISGDYDKNRLLLLSLTYEVYLRYYQPLSTQYKLGNLLTTIISSLTPEELAKLYCIEPDITKPIPVVPYAKGKTYYVMTKSYSTINDIINANNIKNNSTDTTSSTVSYFIFKNYISTDTFMPNYQYRFDLSDSTNTGTMLAFSFNKGEIPLSSPIVDCSGTPGQPGCVVSLIIPSDTNYDSIYPFNSEEKNLYKKYNLSGFTVGSFFIELSAYSKPITELCSRVISLPITEPNIYIYNDIYYELLKLTPSSMIYVYDYKGPRLSMRDIKSKEIVKGVSDRKFGMYKGRTYYIYVPKIYALAILNTTQTSNISYTGDSNKKQIADVLGTEADDRYEFYYGTIAITVNGPFQPMSLYTLNYGYIHAYRVLVYSETCADVPWDTNPYRFLF